MEDLFLTTSQAVNLKALFSYFYQAFYQFFLVFKNWWWILPPFILWKPFLYLWLFWRRELWLKRDFVPTIFEIKFPKESIKPVRAMESVLDGLWQAFWEPPNYWEKWWDGLISLGFQWEIVSVEGDIHIYIRFPLKRKGIVEAAIYSQYPDAELTIAEDYTKKLPPDIPNKEWDMWAADYCFIRPDPYPIKTYRVFEPSASEAAVEEKRVDPMTLLLEAMHNVKPGEQLWVQIQASPIAQDVIKPFIKEGEAIRDKLAKRPQKTKPKPILQEAIEVLVSGPAKKIENKEELFPPEMRLTPGEREVVEGVERKISKSAFRCSARFIFFGKRDVWEKAKLRMVFSYFGSYVTQDMNGLVPCGKTITKVYSRPPVKTLDPARLYLRKRRMLRQYKERFEPTFPQAGNYKTGHFILNSEELASLFHFPSWRVAPTPTIPRVESKRGGPPSDLPTE